MQFLRRVDYCYRSVAAVLVADTPVRSTSAKPKRKRKP